MFQCHLRNVDILANSHISLTWRAFVSYEQKNYALERILKKFIVNWTIVFRLKELTNRNSAQAVLFFSLAIPHRIRLRKLISNEFFTSICGDSSKNYSKNRSSFMLFLSFDLHRTLKFFQDSCRHQLLYTERGH